MTGIPPSSSSMTGQGQLESVPCATCGEDDFEVLMPSRRDPGKSINLEEVFRSSGDEPLQDQLVRCLSCGLVYVRPRLRWDLILEGYRGGSDEGFVSQVAGRERTFRRCLARIGRAAPPPGKRVLDVGAAGGSFLAEARKLGFEVMGCEPSTWMCRFALEHYKLRVEEGTIFEVPLGRGSVDLLTLWDVLEHTPDPRAVLVHGRELLAPGGVLALTVPDYGTLAARLLGRRWPFLLTVHLYYFVFATMKDLLRRCGFEVLRSWPHFQTLELGYVAKRASPYLGPLGNPLRGLLSLVHLERVPFAYWVGQTMFVARKI